MINGNNVRKKRHSNKNNKNEDEIDETIRCAQVWYAQKQTNLLTHKPRPILNAFNVEEKRMLVPIETNQIIS